MAKKSPGIFIRLMLGLNAVLVILLVTCYFSPLADPRQNWILPFTGLAYPYLLLANILFVLAWMLAARYYFLMSLLAILAGWSFLIRIVQWHPGGEALRSGTEFRLLSFNVQNLSLSNIFIDDKKVMQDIFRFISNERPDVLCLQEFASMGTNPDHLLDSLCRLWGLPYHALAQYGSKSARNVFAIVTLSRFPIMNSIQVGQNDTRNYALATDLLNKGDTIRIFNVHLAPIYLKQEDYDFISGSDKDEREEDRFASGSLRILNKFRSAFSRRAVQSESLAGLVSESAYPVIICGDFNDSPFSYTYRQFSVAMTDAFRESGKGFGHTYAGRLPSYRIDYIFLDKRYQCRNFKTYRIRLSDHYPISCVVAHQR
jgi:endonuclease/exonuclease/phosphatase family metal-dependent hydrolase